MEQEKLEYKKWIKLIIITLIGYWIINNLSLLGSLIGNVFSIIFPFILGGCIAFILNIPMAFFERKLLSPKNKKKQKKVKSNKLIRIVSILFSIIVILLILTLIINLIVPELINIVKLLIDNIPYYSEQLDIIFSKVANSNLDIQGLLEDSNINFEEIKNQIINQIPKILTSSISAVGSIFRGITDFFIAIIFSIYILMDKENLGKQIKNLIYAYLSKKNATKMMYLGKVTSNTFKNFFTVQCLEATILGTLCVIGMLILKIPYAVPIGILIGVTALIPIVGAFIGVAIGAVLIVSIAPVKVITFVVFVLILQQIEGNLIYPRVVGNSVGLPGMWVLFAVSVGGSLGGVLGMLLGVPVASIIYTLLKKDVKRKTVQKNV